MGPITACSWSRGKRQLDLSGPTGSAFLTVRHLSQVSSNIEHNELAGRVREILRNVGSSFGFPTLVKRSGTHSVKEIKSVALLNHPRELGMLGARGFYEGRIGRAIVEKVLVISDAYFVIWFLIPFCRNMGDAWLKMI